ncbi:hypothetical protein DCCM_0977 [Desulfocucumis palustris]|uniref:Uncharacterized protein n=1 Tax=Desulfocucumis palustris TaxID=1898651 RepID=A0A2L2XFX7_9FIRM|nr:hypothetical protein DCCM_0977 [Desulfocucumis palustris]
MRRAPFYIFEYVRVSTFLCSLWEQQLLTVLLKRKENYNILLNRIQQAITGTINPRNYP